MIKPTIGRIVWYRPSAHDRKFMTIHNGGQPLAAIVAYVWSDTSVNLTVSDHEGNTFACRDVLLHQGDSPAPDGMTAPYCEWMPFQKGQAAKTESLEQKLKA